MDGWHLLLSSALLVVLIDDAIYRSDSRHWRDLYQKAMVAFHEYRLKNKDL